MTKWDKLRMHRLSMNASIDMSYALSKRINLTGSINYLSHALIDVNNLNQEEAPYDTNYSRRFQAKAGVRWDF